MANDKGLLFFYDWKQAFEALSGDDCKALLLAMLDYRREGIPPPEFEGSAKIAAAFIFPAIDRSMKLSSAGRKGGINSQQAQSGLKAGLKGASKGNASTKQNNTKTKTKTKQEKTSASADKAAAADSSAERLVDLYHRICPSLTPVKSITVKRREAAADLLIRHSEEEITEMFKTAEQSSFLRGEGESGWVASFDWLIEEDHFVKVLEGEYSRIYAQHAPSQPTAYTEDDFFSQFTEEE